MDQPKLLNPLPDEQWMDRLREGDQVWLVKQQKIACVGMPWEPPPPGYRAGKLILDLAYGRIECWYVDGRGNGLDGRPLIHPLHGTLATTPWPATDIERRHARVILASLLERVERLERLVGNPIFRDLDDPGDRVT